MLYFSVCDVRQAGSAAFAFCVTYLLRLKHVHEQVLKISCLDMRFVIMQKVRAIVYAHGIM